MKFCYLWQCANCDPPSENQSSFTLSNLPLQCFITFVGKDIESKFAEIIGQTSLYHW